MTDLTIQIQYLLLAFWFSLAVNIYFITVKPFIKLINWIENYGKQQKEMSG